MSAGVLLSSIGYYVASRPVRLPSHSHTYFMFPADWIFSSNKYCISRPLRSCLCFDILICVRRNPALTNLIFSCRSASQITPVFEYIYMCPLEFCSHQSGILLRVGLSDLGFATGTVKPAVFPKRVSR